MSENYSVLEGFEINNINISNINNNNINSLNYTNSIRLSITKKFQDFKKEIITTINKVNTMQNKVLERKNKENIYTKSVKIIIKYKNNMVNDYFDKYKIFFSNYIDVLYINDNIKKKYKEEIDQLPKEYNSFYDLQIKENEINKIVEQNIRIKLKEFLNSNPEKRTFGNRMKKLGGGKKYIKDKRLGKYKCGDHSHKTKKAKNTCNNKSYKKLISKKKKVKK